MLWLLSLTLLLLLLLCSTLYVSAFSHSRPHLEGIVLVMRREFVPPQLPLSKYRRQLFVVFRLFVATPAFAAFRGRQILIPQRANHHTQREWGTRGLDNGHRQRENFALLLHTPPRARAVNVAEIPGKIQKFLRRFDCCCFCLHVNYWR